jgi:cytidine deaminase
MGASGHVNYGEHFFLMYFRDSEDVYASPCGSCRQIISEFAATRDYWVIMAKPDGSYCIETVDQLLPHSFASKDLYSGQTDK